MSKHDDHPLLQFSQLEDSALAMFFHSLAPIQEYVSSPDVAEIMINRHDNIWVEQAGRMTAVPIKIDPAMLEGAMRSLASSVQKSAVRGTAQGIINAGHDGLRIAAVMSPTSLDGHALSIRRHRDTTLSLNDYAAMGAFSPTLARSRETDVPIFVGGEADAAVADAIRKLVRQRKNVLVAGGTSSGKTTFLNSMTAEIPADERVVTIEDTAELKVPVPNRVRLLSNLDKAVSTQMLVALSLRFRPDRIIVGEVRAGEAFDLIQALNTGHDGGMASVHSSTARSALARLESLGMLGIPAGSRWELNDMRKLIAECFDYVIHLKRSGELRHVSEILEIHGFEDNDYIIDRVF